MSQVSFTVYLEEALGLIQAGEIDQATLILGHLAQLFPRAIALRRLRGELALAAQDYAVAEEHFRRLLEFDPEDFAAHAALARIIEEDDVPAAIAHWELVTEISPENAEAREELARLYALRDNTKPEWMDLSRGALARILLRGREYERAEEELRDLVHQEPERINRQLVLAEALIHLRRVWEAAEICEKILEKNQENLPALAIIALIFHKHDRKEEADPLLTRIQALDPEYSRVQEILGPDSPWPRQEVLIPRLEIEITPPPAPEEAVPIASSPEPAMPIEEYLPSEKEKEEEEIKEEPEPALAPEEVKEEMAQPPVEPVAEEQVVEEAMAPSAAETAELGARLASAREQAVQDNWPAALAEYRALLFLGGEIRAQVIADLEALAQRTEMTEIHQLLGDAYLLAGKVEEASAQYRRLIAKS